MLFQLSVSHDLTAVYAVLGQMSHDLTAVYAVPGQCHMIEQLFMLCQVSFT